MRLSTRYRITHSAISTPTSTRVSLEICTLPGSQVLSGYARGSNLMSLPNCTWAIELIARNMPIVTITNTSGDACSTGRMRMRSIAAPPTNEIAIARTIAIHTGTLRCVKKYTRYVEYNAISPWAKFKMPVVRNTSTSASAIDA